MTLLSSICHLGMENLTLGWPRVESWFEQSDEEDARRDWISCKGFPGGANGKESACQRRWCRRHGFNLWVGKIPYSKKWQPAPVFLPGKFHGQRSLESYDPWGCKELDVTEHPEKVMAGLGSQLELGWWIRQGRVQGFRNGWTQWIWRRHKGLLTLEEET